MRTILALAIVLTANTAEAEPTFDANRSYDLRPLFIGSYTTCLEIEDDGIRNQPILAPCERGTSQQWRLWATGDGYYKLTNADRGDRMCLTHAASPVLRPCGKSNAQRWALRRTGSIWQLTNETGGPDNCLGLAGADGVYRPRMMRCGASSDQRWKIMPR